MAKININSNYQYISNSQKSIIESDIIEKVSLIQSNILDFEMDFNRGTWYQAELKVIAEELKDMARYFLEQQDMAGGRLYNGVNTEVNGDSRIKFYNNARNERGQYYAGHIEYGHKARDGSFVPAFPFMRPALYTVSEASQGRFADTLGNLLSGVFKENGKGYQGIKNLNFGHKFDVKKNFSMHYKSGQLGRPHHLTRKGLAQKSKKNPENFIAESLHESQFREPFSARKGINSVLNNHNSDINFGERNLNINMEKTFREKVTEKKRNR